MFSPSGINGRGTLDALELSALAMTAAHGILGESTGENGIGILRPPAYM
jgi:hypothetical protein